MKNPKYEAVKKNLTRQPKTWLVTGCAGFIGSHLVEHLKTIDAGQICKKLKISRGSTSQGLRFLKELGAIRSSGLNGNQAEHFEAEEHLRLALENFILKKISPALKEIGQKIKKLEKITPELDQHALAEKLDALKRWHKHGKLLLPIVTGFLKTMPLLTRK